MPEQRSRCSRFNNTSVDTNERLEKIMNTDHQNTSLRRSLQSVQNGQPGSESVSTRGSRLCFSDTQEAGATHQILPVVDRPESDRLLLEALIADLTALMGLHLLYKVYEWTVEGSSWFVHRSLAIDLGCAVARSIDLLADRIVGLGGIPIPDLSDQSFQSQWEAGSTTPKSPQEMVGASLRTERKIVEKLNEHRRLARAHQDYLTDDVLSHLLAKHANHIKDLLSAKDDELYLVQSPVRMTTGGGE